MAEGKDFKDGEVGTRGVLASRSASPGPTPESARGRRDGVLGSAIEALDIPRIEVWSSSPVGEVIRLDPACPALVAQHAAVVASRWMARHGL